LKINKCDNFERNSVLMKRISEDIDITENVNDLIGIIKNKYISPFEELFLVNSIHSFCS
jgi:hypothetical protein